MTGEHLANLVGISVSYVSELEHNRNNPSLDLLERLAEKLDVSHCWLIDPHQTSPLDSGWPAKARIGMDQEEWAVYLRLVRKIQELGVDPALVERIIEALGRR